MFISPAFAQDAAAGATSESGMVAFLPFLLVLVVFYFLVIRPQSRRVQAHRDMVQSLKKGDKIVTGGGILATVSKVVNDDEILVKIADGVEVKVMRATIMTALHPEKKKPA